MLKKLLTTTILLFIIAAFVLFVAKSLQKTSGFRLMGGSGKSSITITKEEIYLWENYKNGKLSGVIGKAHHGEKIVFINKMEKAAFVKTAKGQVGWVYTRNIKESQNSGIFTISTK